MLVGILPVYTCITTEENMHDQEEALRLQHEIERAYPQLRCELRKYGALWSVEVTNPRTQEQINVVDPATWQARLQTMTGAL